MKTRNIAAVDLGASSGRVLLVRFDGRALSLEEMYRFPNRRVMVHGHRFWNILSLWDDTLTTPAISAISIPKPLHSLAIEFSLKKSSSLSRAHDPVRSGLVCPLEDSSTQPRLQKRSRVVYYVAALEEQMLK